MRTVYINTSEEKCYVAFFEDIQQIHKVEWESRGRLGDNILLQIEDGLSLMSWSKDDLNLVLVHPGPGSFTGVRIGVSTANALAWSLNIPVISSINPLPALSNLQLKGGGNEDTTHIKSFSKIVSPRYGVPPSVTLKS